MRRRTLPPLIAVALFLVVLLVYTTFGPQGPAAPEPTAAPPTRTPGHPTVTPSPSPTASPTPSPTATPRPTFPRQPAPSPTVLPRPALAYGISVHLYGLDRGRALDLVAEGGFGWIRQQVWWRYLEPWKGTYAWGDLDDLVAQANARGLKVLLSVVRSPGWAAGGSYGLPYDPEHLGDFLHETATRYRGQVHAYEIWNEPNLARENAGRVAEPEDYVELLHVAYRRIKEADPEAYVISAPLTPTGVNRVWIAVDDMDYLGAMLAYSDGLFLASCDAIGVHAAGSNNPPDTRWPERPGPGEWTTHSSFYFRHVEDIRALLQGFDAEKPLWITEFGWATANYSWGFGYGYDNSEEEQAAYIVRALQIAEREWPYVEGVFLWNLNFAVVQGDLHEQGAFGILRSDWTPQPAYWAVQAHLQWVQTTPPPPPGLTP